MRFNRVSARESPTDARRSEASCRALRVSLDLQVHNVLLVLAGVEWPVRGDPVDGDQRPVQDDVGVPGPRRVPDRLVQPRRPCGEQRDRLLHVPPGSGRADPEPGREASERFAFAQADQDQEGLLPGFSFRHSEPIEFRWRRMIPAAKFRV